MGTLMIGAAGIAAPTPLPARKWVAAPKRAAQRPTRLERLLARAVAADNAEFAALAFEMPLPTWQRACRERLLRRFGDPGWDRDRWDDFHARAQRAYEGNCAYMAALPPSPRIVRPDLGRLYESFDTDFDNAAGDAQTESRR